MKRTIAGLLKSLETSAKTYKEHYGHKWTLETEEVIKTLPPEVLALIKYRQLKAIISLSKVDKGFCQES